MDSTSACTINNIMFITCILYYGMYLILLNIDQDEKK